MISENTLFLATEEKAAELPGISIKTLQSWRWKGIGPAFVKVGRVGRLVRYRLSALEEFIEKNTTLHENMQVWSRADQETSKKARAHIHSLWICVLASYPVKQA